jgi:hypothetical protein
MNIPLGTTHVELANPLNFNQTPTFLRYDFDFRSEISDIVYGCWYIWHQNDWHKDYGYQKPRDNPLRLMSIFSYKERMKDKEDANIG